MEGHEAHELVVAKINAAIKILEWAKDDIEPGIGGNPQQLHAALADAFKSIYRTVSEAVAEQQSSKQAAAEPPKAEAVPIGG